MVLHRELAGLGFTGSYQQVQRYLKPNRAQRKQTPGRYNESQAAGAASTIATPMRTGTARCTAIIHCPDDGVRLLRHAALALCLGPRPVREMRPASAAGSQASMRRNSHNDRAAKIARARSKPAEFKVKVKNRLTIIIRLSRLLHA